MRARLGWEDTASSRLTRTWGYFETGRNIVSSFPLQNEDTSFVNLSRPCQCCPRVAIYIPRRRPHKETVTPINGKHLDSVDIGTAKGTDNRNAFFLSQNLSKSCITERVGPQRCEDEGYVVVCCVVDGGVVHGRRVRFTGLREGAQGDSLPAWIIATDSLSARFILPQMEKHSFSRQNSLFYDMLSLAHWSRPYSTTL